jgi:hypothetical protein
MQINTLMGFGWRQEESYSANVLIRIREAEMDAKVVGAPTNSSRGRPFAKGNAGRKPGAKNRTTLVAEALLRDEETELVRKAIELAKAGDGPMLKFLLDRILPKERSIQFDLPAINSACQALDALKAIIDGVGAAQITPNEAAALANLVASYARTLDVTELEIRVNNLENKLEQIPS